MKWFGAAAIGAALALCGCGAPAPGEEDQPASEAPAEILPPEADARIECRIGNARQFERFCLVSFGESEAGRTITLRKPDGGFRRLLVTRDGRGVVAADGAEPASVSIIGDQRIEVTIGVDSFRLPATIARQ